MASITIHAGGLSAAARLSSVASRSGDAAPPRAASSVWPRGRCSSAVRMSASKGSHGSEADVGRRGALAMSLAGAALIASPRQALAFTPPPPGYRRWYDKLDGYEFLYPDDWIPVNQTNADVFWRNPSNLEMNCYVDISSPSSSKYTSVKDLGSADDAGQRMLKQYVVEFMSTRIGVRREPELISVAERTGGDGLQYYEVRARVRSYANENQFGITPQERVQIIEFDRTIVSVLGVRNKRLYELRMQGPTSQFDSIYPQLQTIGDSLKLFEPRVA